MDNPTGGLIWKYVEKSSFNTGELHNIESQISKPVIGLNEIFNDGDCHSGNTKGV